MAPLPPWIVRPPSDSWLSGLCFQPCPPSLCPRLVGTFCLALKVHLHEIFYFFFFFINSTRLVPWFIPEIRFEYKIKFAKIFKLFVTLRWFSSCKVNFCFKLHQTFSIFWLMLAPFDHFMVNFSKSYPFKGARAGYVCLFCLIHLPHTESMWSETLRQLRQRGVSLSVNWGNAEWDSMSTESTLNETPYQLSQLRRHQHLWRFHYSVLTQLTWSLTPRWLSQHGVLLCVDSK
jgi:hypothetical protein